ncbi:uncharacterized protein LOC115791699 [Archocentrus centrarchus]|uniref:uncharacterized protein LOC115791699 n=1 Tax=Archocentrus centrarchus TaxID=63155 RepID=UPI0011E9E4F8|nr:uncharacterized protein LOC115791699 [Archocentrus centrarchus]
MEEMEKYWDALEGSEEQLEVKTQTKWTNFRVKKKRKELEDLLEKIMKERDELEIMKIKIMRQKEGVEQKLEDTVAEMKIKTENAGAEMINTWEKMLRTQRKMGKNQEEIKNCMEKLTSMKAWINKWILSHSTIKQTFSVNASRPQEPKKETHRDSRKNQASGIPKEEGGAEIIPETLEDQHQNEEIKEQQNKDFEPKHLFATDKKGEQDICLQRETEIHKKAIDDDETELLIIVRDSREVEKLISNLKQQEEEIKGQIKYTVDDMEEKGQDIKRLIMEINDLQKQRPYNLTAIRETENVGQGWTKLLEETDHRHVLIVKSKVFKSEKMKYKEENSKQIKHESDLTRVDVSEESGEEIQKQAEQTDREDTGRADIQRLRAEIYRTQEIIRMVKGGLENPEEKSNMDRDQKNEGGEIEGLLKDITQFQAFLEMVKSTMKQSEVHMTEEMSSMKSMKTAVKKKRRELDQRLEKTLKERDELEILKIKMQRQTELIQQNFEKMAKVKCTIEKMAAKARKKSAETEINMKETEIKLRQFKDLYCMTEAAKQDMEANFTPKERAGQDFKTEIMKTKDTERDKLTGDTMGKETEETEILRKVTEKLKEIKLTLDSLGHKNGETEQTKTSVSEEVKQMMERKETEMMKQIQTEMGNVRIAKQQAVKEIQELNHLREKTESHKQEIIERVQKSQTEMELLRSKLEIKRNECEHCFRKTMRKKEEIEIMWNEIQQEKKTLRRETKKKRRELDQRLERIMRERDEVEVLRVKLNRQKEELVEEKQTIKNHNLFIYLHSEHEKHLENKDVNIFMEKLKQHSSKVYYPIIYMQTMKEKIHIDKGTIKREIKILEKVNADLERQRKGLREFEALNMIIRNNMERLKCQLKIIFEKLTIQDRAEMNDDIQKQKLEIRLENVKRERQEMEVLMSELEMKKKENEKVIKRSNQKEQEMKKVCAALKEERIAIKRERQWRKKELNKQRKRITGQRDELKMKQKLQRGNDENKCQIEEMMKRGIPMENHWQLMKICLEKCKQIKIQTEIMIGVIQDEKQHMQDEARLSMLKRKEIINMKMEVKQQKEMIKCALKNMQQLQKYLEQLERNITQEQNRKDRRRRQQFQFDKQHPDKLTVNLTDDEEDLERLTEMMKGTHQLKIDTQELEKEQVSEMKTDIDKERELMLDEKRNMEEERSELK